MPVDSAVHDDPLQRPKDRRMMDDEHFTSEFDNVSHTLFRGVERHRDLELKLFNLMQLIFMKVSDLLNII